MGCKPRVITLKSTLVSARQLNGIDANPKENLAISRLSLSLAGESNLRFTIQIARPRTLEFMKLGSQHGKHTRGMQTVTMAFLIGSFKLLPGLATRFQGGLGLSAFAI